MPEVWTVGWDCPSFPVCAENINDSLSLAMLKRIAKKYAELVEKCFEETENLWEKYNVKDGNVLVSQEGDHKKMPAIDSL